MPAYYTFKEKDYGIEFVLEHTASIDPNLAMRVAQMVIAERKKLLFDAWRMIPKNQIADVNPNAKMDELFRAKPLDSPVRLREVYVQGLLAKLQPDTDGQNFANPPPHAS